MDSLKREYAYIRDRLEELCREQAITEYIKCMIIDMTNKVAELDIPACDKDFQFHWRTRAYTGVKFGKS